MKIDSLDKKILNILSEDAKIPYTEVAKKLNVSSGTIHVRMKKMEDMDIVQGATLKLNYPKLGYDITCFLGVYLEKSSMYKNVVERLKKVREISTISYTTGKYNIICTIHCENMQHLREVLYEKIQQIENIDSTETFISLEHSVNQHISLI